MPESGPRLAIGMIGVLLMSFVLYFMFRNSMDPDGPKDNEPRHAAEALAKGDVKKAKELVEAICTRTTMVAMRRSIVAEFGTAAFWLAMDKKQEQAEGFLDLCIAIWRAKMEGETALEGVLHGNLADLKSTAGKKDEASAEYETAIAMLGMGKSPKDQLELGSFLRGYADHLVKNGRPENDPQVTKLRAQEEEIFKQHGRLPR